MALRPLEAAGPEGHRLAEAAIHEQLIGGLEPAKVYPWFSCRVSQRENGLFFEKRNGSERLSGYIEEGRNGLILLGTAALAWLAWSGGVAA